MRGPTALAFLVTVILVSSAPAQDIKFRSVQTGDLRLVYYNEEHAYIIPHLTRCFVNSMGFHRKLFGYEPSEPVTVILRDLNDHGYAGATSLPFNYLILGIEPFEQVFETSPTNERINWVMSHELLHVVASDQSASTDRFFRKLFHGKVMTSADNPESMVYSYLTSPRMYAPRWYHEGMAVFMETWMAGGYGRAIGGYDEMVFRTMVAEDARFYDVVGLESEGKTTDFQIGQVSYLYGTRFICYLAYRYGPDTVIRWLNRSDGSRRNFATQFKKVYSTGLDDEWSRWIEFEHQWQQVNLDSIRQYPVTEYRPLTQQALGSASRTCFDPERRRLYSAVLYPGEVAHIVGVDLDTWQSEKLQEIPTPALYYVAALAYDQESETIFYTTDNSQQWRDLRALDLASGKSRLLQQDIRTGDLALNRADRSLWGIRHHNGLTRLVTILPPYTEGFEILELPFGRDLFDIDVSPDGRWLTGTLIEVNGKQRLIRMRIEDLMIGDSTFETLYEFPNYSPANFVYSLDGRYLFGTTYSTGVSNVTRYDFVERKMEWITNGDTGYFRPLPVSEDSLIVLRYTSKGFQPVMIANQAIEDVSAIRFLGQAIVKEHPSVREWMLGSPLDVEVDTTAFEPFDYGGIRDVRMGTAYPVFESYKDRFAMGLRLNFQDPMWFHGLDLRATYSPSTSLPSKERAHVTANYSHWPWDLNFWYNRADFYDFFGPTKTSRKGYGLELTYKGVVQTARPKSFDYHLGVAGYAGLDRLPNYQNVRATFEEYINASAGMQFKNYRKTIGAVEHEKGLGWDLDVAYNWVNPESPTNVSGVLVEQKNYPAVWASLDLGFALPWDHSSVWLRPSGGYAYFKKGNREEPLANFFFGGFGNNWVDHREVKRYREFYAFPGVELNEIGGNNFAKMLLEWTMPPLRFARFGVPRLYCNWAHLRLFASGLSVNVDSENIRRDVMNAGAQLDFQLVIFATMSSTFSLGYAAAWEEKQRPSYEFMISLKIL